MTQLDQLPFLSAEAVLFSWKTKLTNRRKKSVLKFVCRAIARHHYRDSSELLACSHDRPSLAIL